MRCLVWCVNRAEISKMPVAIFVTLNIIDAYVTKTALALGAVQLNPLMTSTGSSMIIKGLIAIALVFILYCFAKEKVLWPLNFALVGIVLWNLVICWIVALNGSIIL